jgi:hypothetical protein
MGDEEKTARLKKMPAQIVSGKAIEAVSRPATEAAERGGFKSLGPSDAAATESGLQKLTEDRVQEIASSEIFGLEPIILPRNRSVIFVRGDSHDDLQDLWHSFNGDDVKRPIATLLPLIGRVEVPSSPNITIRGIGFVVGRGLIATNGHGSGIRAGTALTGTALSNSLTAR